MKRLQGLPALLGLLACAVAVAVAVGADGKDDVRKLLGDYGVAGKEGEWVPYDPDSREGKTLEGSNIALSGTATSNSCCTRAVARVAKSESPQRRPK